MGTFPSFVSESVIAFWLLFPISNGIFIMHHLVGNPELRELEMFRKRYNVVA